ncbi:zinc-ribbon domain containing protein [Candidatus Falkowbacteria bacterium]|nr:zinc-ribbon domain containing protein [Candidatus Falkowbacteria bacterium]
MPTCKNCTTAFTITEQDKTFYARINVPAPTLCPACRQQRRLSWRNERTFYQGVSDLSGKPILSIYHPSKPFPVYDQAEWWSDAWDPFDYGREIDWQRSLLAQINELFQAVPRPSLFNRNCVNSYYGNIQESNLNCYYEVGSGWCEESYYSTINIHCKNIMDSHYAHQCELSYYLVNCEHCYSCVYCQNCHNCLETYFSYNCRGCTNCFGCVNLRNVQYYWFNQPVGEAEFIRRIASLGSYAFWQKMKQEFLAFRASSLQPYAVQVKCERSTGDYLSSCEDVRSCFDLVEATNCAYCYRGEKITDSLDCDIGGWPASNLYEVLSADTSSAMIGTVFCWENSFIQYCYHCFTSQDLFGCSLAALACGGSDTVF